jgi:hypothetical protein
MAPVSQKRAKQWLIVRRDDDQDLAKGAQHQRP